MTKTELNEKVGKKLFLADDYTIAAKLNYESGIPSFDKYLNGKKLKQIGAVIHLTKYPKGLVFKIAKLFSSFPFGISYSEIRRTLLLEKPDTSNLIFETSNGKITFSLKTSNIYDVRTFLDEIHLPYENTETKSKSEEKKRGQNNYKEERNKSYSNNRQEYKEKRQNNYNGNSSKTSIDEALEILGVKRSATKEEIKKAYRNLVKKYNTDQRSTYEEHIKQMMDDKMKEINSAKELLQKSGWL